MESPQIKAKKSAKNLKVQKSAKKLKKDFFCMQESGHSLLTGNEIDDLGVIFQREKVSNIKRYDNSQYELDSDGNSSISSSSFKPQKHSDIKVSLSSSNSRQRSQSFSQRLERFHTVDVGVDQPNKTTRCVCSIFGFL